MELTNNQSSSININNTKPLKYNYDGFNIYHNLVVFRNNKLVFVTVNGSILYCDINIMKICKITNPIVDEKGIPKQIHIFINDKYIIISYKNHIRIAILPDITDNMNKTDITLEWQTLINPYDNTLPEEETNLSYTIGAYYDNIYLTNGKQLYLYNPELKYWKMFNPLALDCILDMDFENNPNVLNILYQKFSDKKSYIFRLIDNKNINSDIIYKEIKNPHNKITKYFTHNSAYNFIAKVDDFTIKTNTLDNYILDTEDETTWIERRIPFKEDNEIIVSCTNTAGYFIIATYKAIYYCVIGKWYWQEMEVLEAPEPYQSTTEFSIRKYNSSATENTTKDNDSESKYVEIDRGIRNLWTGLYNTCATTIDGRVFRILEESGELICAEIYCYDIHIINFISLVHLLVESRFLDEYLIVIDNLKEEIFKKHEKYIENYRQINDKPDIQSNIQSNTTTVDEKDMHTTEPETTGTFDSYTTGDGYIDKPITTLDSAHTTTLRVHEIEPLDIL
jgi:hypothetical protein